MFAVGLATLIIKAFEIAAQRTALGSSLLGPATKSLQPVEECNVLLARLERLPPRRQSEYYVARVRAALEHVSRHGSGRPP